MLSPAPGVDCKSMPPRKAAAAAAITNTAAAASAAGGAASAARTKSATGGGSDRKSPKRAPAAGIKRARSTTNAQNKRLNLAQRLKQKELQLAGQAPPTPQQPQPPPPQLASSSIRQKEHGVHADDIMSAQALLAERRCNARLRDEQRMLREQVEDRDRFIAVQLSAGVCRTYANRYGQDDVDEILRRMDDHIVQFAHQQLAGVSPSHPQFAHREFIAKLAEQAEALVRDSLAMRGFYTASE